jgi:hypothetical protein
MSSRIVVPAMTLDEYREGIEGPASVKVLYFQGKGNSQEFINRLIGDVANTLGALPLLSFTLSELYRRYQERRGDDRSLREEDYERLGASAARSAAGLTRSTTGCSTTTTAARCARSCCG